MYNEFIKIKQSNEAIEYFKRDLKKRDLFIQLHRDQYNSSVRCHQPVVVFYRAIFLINGYLNKFMLIMFTLFLYKLNNYRLHFEKKNDRLFNMYLSPKTIKYKYFYLLALLSLTSFL